MKKINRKDFSTLMLWILVLTCVCITYKNYVLNKEVTEKSLAEKAEWLSMQDIATAHDIHGLSITDIHGDTMPLTSLAHGDQRIGIYANRMHCSDCWKTVVHNIRNICHSYNLGEPFLLADDFTLLDMRIMSKKDSLKVPLYLLQPYEVSFLKRLALKDKPFIFLLRPDSVISSILFYEDTVVPAMVEYLKGLSPDSMYTDSLVIPKSTINLGGVPNQREFTLCYTLTNHSDQEFMIKNVVPFCSCIVPEDNPKKIGARKSVELRFKFISDGFGTFERKIKMYTDQRKEPYTVRVVGYCQ